MWFKGGIIETQVGLSEYTMCSYDMIAHTTGCKSQSRKSLARLLVVPIRCPLTWSLFQVVA